MRNLICALLVATAACGAHPPPAIPQSQNGTPRFSPNGIAAFRDPTTGEWVRGPGVMGPKAVFAPNADFPLIAVQDGLSGVVTMDVLVSATGQVSNVTVTGSIRADIDRLAEAKVKTWRFEPAQKGGKAVPSLVTVTMSFTMR